MNPKLLENTIRQIERILADETLDDFQCVENIVILFEFLGLETGGRHDF